MYIRLGIQNIDHLFLIQSPLTDKLQLRERHANV